MRSIRYEFKVRIPGHEEVNYILHNGNFVTIDLERVGYSFVIASFHSKIQVFSNGSTKVEYLNYWSDPDLTIEDKKAIEEAKNYLDKLN